MGHLKWVTWPKFYLVQVFSFESITCPHCIEVSSLMSHKDGGTVGGGGFLLGNLQPYRDIATQRSGVRENTFKSNFYNSMTKINCFIVCVYGIARASHFLSFSLHPPIKALHINGSLMARRLAFFWHWLVMLMLEFEEYLMGLHGLQV